MAPRGQRIPTIFSQVLQNTEGLDTVHCTNVPEYCAKKTGGSHKLETALNLTVGGALGSVFGFEAEIPD